MTTPMRILLVEDSPGDAHLLEEEARDGGIADLVVTQATRVDEALRIYEPGDFDLILLDLNLPDTKGIRTVERVAGAITSTPIVVLTTLGDDTMAERAIAAGADDYLVKGECEAWQLARALRRAVARRRRPERQVVAPEPAEASVDMTLPPWRFGEARLRTQLPNVFDDVVGAVGDLIDLALRCPVGHEQRMLVPQVQIVASRLAVLMATPSDVVDVHVAAVSRKVMTMTWNRNLAQARAASWIRLALVAELCECYRRVVLEDASARAS